MLDKIPDDATMKTLLGAALYGVWTELCAMIEAKYDMERLWDKGYKEWVYEYKYRRGGKTLCTLYAKENGIHCLIILGREERKKFEAGRGTYSEAIQKIYDETETYHDGKWLWTRLTDRSLFADIEKLLLSKRRPNRK